MNEHRGRQASFAGTIGAIVIALVAARTAPARIVRNTIDPSGVVTVGGRHLILTGPLECTPGERAYLEVTVTQRTTGAIAAGRGMATCTGLVQQWDVVLDVEGDERFDDGPALAVAIARTTKRGVATDAHQWLVPVTLTDE